MRRGYPYGEVTLATELADCRLGILQRFALLARLVFDGLDAAPLFYAGQYDGGRPVVAMASAKAPSTASTS